MNKNWIGLSFGNKEIYPILDTTGQELREEFTVKNVGSIGIYLTDEAVTSYEKIGNITWPAEISQGDLIITYRPEENAGDVILEGTDYIWSYVTEENAGKNKTTAKRGSAIDKAKVRELEEEKQQKMKVFYADELMELLEKEIYGQEEAIRKVSEIIASKFRRKKSEVTVIMLFGPTGVGKSTLGEILPEALKELTGVEYGFTQVAMNELVGDHYASRFFGGAATYVGYGGPTVFHGVKKNAKHVLLFDEIEKAAEGISKSLMEVFSTGKVHMADNSEDIDLSEAIIIITTNLKINMKEYNELPSYKKKEYCRNIFAESCGHPEIAGKISNCLAMQELPEEIKMDIMEKFVRKELENYDIILEKIEPSLVLELKEMDTNYGARGVRDAVRDALVNYTAYDRHMDRFKGKCVKLTGSMEGIHMEICEEESL